jgi:hypothetical protein
MTSPPPPPPLDISATQAAMDELGSTIGKLGTALQKMMADTTSLNLGDKLESQIQSALAKFSSLPEELSRTSGDLQTSLQGLSQRVSEQSGRLADQFRRLNAASMSSSAEAEIAREAARAEIFSILDIIKGLGEEFKPLSDKLKEMIKFVDEAKKANQELAKSMNKTIGDMIANKLAQMSGDKDVDSFANVLKTLGSKITAVFSEIGKIAQAGIQKSTELGLSAVEGVGLEFSNRAKQFGSVFTSGFDPAKMVSPEKIQAMQSAAMSTFVNMSEGMQLSSAGMAKFQVDLQKGFNSEFQVTEQSLRALATVGATSVEGFEEFRIASGRAGLSGNQFASIVSKNSLSFLLYGNSIAKAAADFDRLGISLASVQRGQESFVTNLDGGIDTIAQLNQLGATLDFGTLAQLTEFGTPDQVAAYIRSAIPTGMLDSASVRSLVGQLIPGIDAETLLKMAKTGQSLDELEARVSETANGTNSATNATAAITKGFSILTGTFTGLISSSVTASIALYRLAASAAANSGGLFGPTGLFAKMGALGSIATGAAGLGIGIGGIMTGRSLVGQGNTTSGTIIGALGGGIGAAMLALALAPFTGGTSLLALGIAGGLGAAAGGLAAYSAKPANDFADTGYGDRVLLTPKTKTAYAFNNADDIIAGTNLFPKGALQFGGSDNSELVNRVDKLISALSDAKTTVNIDGTMRTVPRMQMVGVNMTRQGEAV